MGALGNPKHERFCQEVHKRIWAGGAVSDSRTEAYKLVGFDSSDTCVADNARKLANRKDVKARLAELAEYAAKLAGIDAAWGMVKLRQLVEFNLDDFLSPPDAMGYRYFDLSEVPSEKIGLLAELSLEQVHEAGATKDDPGREIRKVRLKGSDRISALSLMAKIGGWEAPVRKEITGAGGGPIETRELGALSDEELEQIAAGRAA
jgi:hypothetical protein